MKYSISISEDGTYVAIRVFEAVTRDVKKEFAEKAIKEARQRGIDKFLVDVRGAPNIASTSEQYFFGYADMDQFGLNRSSKIAVLADKDDESHNFIETVFRNAGYICRIFLDESAALTWLAQ